MLSITNNSIKHQSFKKKDQTVLFQTISHKSFVCTYFKCQDRSIWPIDRTLSGATIPGLSGPGSDGNDGYWWKKRSIYDFSKVINEKWHAVLSRIWNHIAEYIPDEDNCNITRAINIHWNQQKFCNSFWTVLTELMN